MIVDLNLIPQTFDMLHAGLTASSVLLLLIAVVSRVTKVHEKVVEKPVERSLKLKSQLRKSSEVEKVVEVERVNEKVVKLNLSWQQHRLIQQCNYCLSCSKKRA